MADEDAPDPEVVKQQGRDGGDQHPGDELLDADSDDVKNVLAGLQQDEADLKEEE